MQGLRRIPVAVFAAVLAFAVPAAAGPPPTEVKVEDDVFRPGNATQLLGASTIWSWQPSVDNEHNVREDSKLFFSGPLTDDPKTVYSSNVPAGTFHYYCEIHGDKRGGMDGVVKVKPVLGPPADGHIPVAWGDALFGAVRYDVQFRVNKRKWKTWLKDTSEVEGDFGASGKPVTVKTGKTYSFRARTQKPNNGDKVSDYSPVVKRLVEAP